MFRLSLFGYFRLGRKTFSMTYLIFFFKIVVFGFFLRQALSGVDKCVVKLIARFRWRTFRVYWLSVRVTVPMWQSIFIGLLHKNNIEAIVKYMN